MNSSLNDFDFTDGEIKEQLELLGKIQIFLKTYIYSTIIK